MVHDHYLAIAGGLSRGDLRELSQYADVFIVGSAITSSETPEKVTRGFMNELRRNV